MVKSTSSKNSTSHTKPQGPSAATLQMLINFAASYRVKPSAMLKENVELSMN